LRGTGGRPDRGNGQRPKGDGGEPRPDPPVQDELTRAYAAALPRVLAELRWKFLIEDLAVLVLLVYLGRVAVRLIQSATASSPSWAVLVAATAYGSVIIAGGVLVCISARSLRESPRAVDVTAANAGPGILRFLISRPLHVALVMTTVITGLLTPIDELEALRLHRGFSAFQRAAGYSSNLVTFWAILALAELWVLTLLYASQENRVGRPRSLDRVAVRLVVVTAKVTTCAEHPLQVGNRDVRSLVGALERVAREAEHSPMLGVPWQDTAGRRAARGDGVRLAEVIRAHKAPLMRASKPDDFVDVAWSLRGGLIAWARDDLAAMVQDAPGVVVPSRSRPWLLRLGPCLVLAALGIVLPLLPPLNEVAQAAEAARLSLLAGALMAVVTGSVQTPDYVETVMEKTVLAK
jgi:hypothetical protein